MSYSDLYDIAKAQTTSHGPRKRIKKKQTGRSWEALDAPDSVTARLPPEPEPYDDALQKELLRASQQEYLFASPSLLPRQQPKIPKLTPKAYTMTSLP